MAAVVGIGMVTLLGFQLSTAASGSAAAMPLLGHEPWSSDISSTYGSGDFGSWEVDQFGLPAYRYTMDEATDPRARNVETGATTTFHQVGNDDQHGFATNDGYTELWSQSRLYEYVNRYEPSYNHYSGGFGYLNINDSAGKPTRSLSTLYLDRPAGASTARDFGIGYFHHALSTTGINADEYVYAPFGSDPVLLHDVTLTNTTSSPENLTWFEYWDVDPNLQPGSRYRGLQAPVWDPTTKTLSVAQLPDGASEDLPSVDNNPQTIFASALNTPVSAYETDISDFFGSGGRATPAEVTAGQLSDTLSNPWAPSEFLPSGNTMFAFQTPVSALPPGASVTLHYAYGLSYPGNASNQITGLVDKYTQAFAGAEGVLGQSEAAWQRWVPQASFPDDPWLARELQWDAYNIRSRSTPEDLCGGYSILSQGGIYQYTDGIQEAFRDPLQHAFPMIYADPQLARQVILYSAAEQNVGAGNIPYGTDPLCDQFDLATNSDDFDVWLIWASAEYGLATRDWSFFDTPVAFRTSPDGQVDAQLRSTGGAPTGTLWQHLQLALTHQEDVVGHGLHGLPNGGAIGDWADSSVETNQMTESTLVGAQLAYVYPLLAQVAQARGDVAFQSELLGAAGAYKKAVSAAWVDAGGGYGFYNRGYSGTQPIGATVTSMFSLTQPWAILAGIPDANQTAQIVKTVRRYLTGVGAPGGPVTGGSALIPCPCETTPGATAASQYGTAGVIEHSVGAWFAIDGPLAWSEGVANAQDPGAAAVGWDELVRNTLAEAATAHPDHWDGTISTDDVCDVYWTGTPYQCGNASGDMDTQILHQPAWGLFATLKFAGLNPTADGYDITPQVPMGSFDLRFPTAGIDQSPGRLMGYLTPVSSGTMKMRVAVPTGAEAVKAYVEGDLVPATIQSGMEVFDLPTTANQPADWAVTWTTPARPITTQSSTLSSTTVKETVLATPTNSAPTTPAIPPTNICTAAAGASCSFTADNINLDEGYVSGASPSTSFTIVDDTTSSKAVPDTVYSGTGPGAGVIYFVPGDLYTLTVGAGSGAVTAGDVSVYQANCQVTTDPVNNPPSCGVTE